MTNDVSTNNNSYKSYFFVKTLNSTIIKTKAESILLHKVFSTPLVLFSKLNFYYSSEFLLNFYSMTLKKVSFRLNKTNTLKSKFNFLKYFNYVIEKTSTQKSVFSKRLLNFGFRRKFVFQHKRLKSKRLKSKRRKRNKKLKVFLNVEFSCIDKIQTFLNREFSDINQIQTFFRGKRFLKKPFDFLYRKRIKKPVRVFNFLKLQNLGFLHYHLYNLHFPKYVK